MTRHHGAVELEAFDIADHMDNRESQAFFLSDALATGNRAYILHVLNALARAQGMSDIAKKSGMKRQSLYAALGPDGNPTLENLLAIIGALGLHLSAGEGIEAKALEDA